METNTRCLSVKDTVIKTGQSRSALYAILALKESDFPRPLKIGRRTYFLEAEIDAWILSRPRVTSKAKCSEAP